jgi:signal transduction histidine kinase
MGDRRTRSTGDPVGGGSQQAAAAADAPRATASPPAGELAERVAELESELAAAHKTIKALLDKAEQREASLSPSVAAFEAAARMEEVIAQRTREAEEKGVALERANQELRDLTSNLDKIVKQRTRALRESEAQLRRKNEELKRLNHMKGEFISIAAHELRTPLTSIVGYIELMLEGRFGTLSQSLQRPVASVRRNAHRLTRLVDEMLDVSCIEAGRMMLRRASVELSKIVSDVVDELNPLANTKNQTLATRIEEEVCILADADKIHQVTCNLVANAIRYTDEGGLITIIVDNAPQDRYAGSWGRLRVRDNGIGIPSSLQQRIFEPFSDVNSAKHHTSSGPGSAGLGLYIARGLVDLHGGLITLDSEEGKGTEFTVLLPLATEEATTSATQA